MVLRMKNFNIFGVTEKSNFQGAGSRETNIEPKMGVLGQFPDLKGGGLARKRGWCFRGGDTPMHTMSYPKII